MNHKAVVCLCHIVMVGKQIIGDLMLPFSPPLHRQAVHGAERKECSMSDGGCC